MRYAFTAEDWEVAFALIRAYPKLRAALERMQKDAERYQHMRANAAFQDRNGPGLYWYLPRYNLELPIGERLDAAIDSAMQGEQQ